METKHQNGINGSDDLTLAWQHCPRCPSDPITRYPHYSYPLLLLYSICHLSAARASQPAMRRETCIQQQAQTTRFGSPVTYSWHEMQEQEMQMNGQEGLRLQTVQGAKGARA